MIYSLEDSGPISGIRPLTVKEVKTISFTNVNSRDVLNHVLYTIMKDKQFDLSAPKERDVIHLYAIYKLTFLNADKTLEDFEYLVEEKRFDDLAKLFSIDPKTYFHNLMMLLKNIYMDIERLESMSYWEYQHYCDAIGLK